MRRWHDPKTAALKQERYGETAGLSPVQPEELSFALCNTEENGHASWCHLWVGYQDHTPWAGLVSTLSHCHRAGGGEGGRALLAPKLTCCPVWGVLGENGSPYNRLQTASHQILGKQIDTGPSDLLLYQ